MRALILMLCMGPLWAFDVSAIEQRIAAANGIRALPISVRDEVEIWCSLACTDGTRIIISTEALSYVKNEDELAALIGHELAHTQLIGETEVDADLRGLDYLEKAGYNRCRGAKYLIGLIGDSKHPSGAQRYRNTQCS
jgi:hypothetical protein